MLRSLGRGRRARARRRARPSRWRPTRSPAAALGGGRDGVVVEAAGEEDWASEYLALVIAVRVVDSVRRGDRAHRPLRQRALRGDRHPRHRRRAALPARGGRGVRVRERLDALHRRRGVRHGRRDRQLDAEAARARADRPARAVHVQVPHRRGRARPRLRTAPIPMGSSRILTAADAGRSSIDRHPRRDVQPAASRPSRGRPPRPRGARARAGADDARVHLPAQARRAGSRPRASPAHVSPAASRAIDGLSVCALEIERGGPSYTVDTLQRHTCKPSGRPADVHHRSGHGAHAARVARAGEAAGAGRSGRGGARRLAPRGRAGRRSPPCARLAGRPRTAMRPAVRFLEMPAIDDLLLDGARAGGAGRADRGSRGAGGGRATSPSTASTGHGRAVAS